MCLLFFEIAMFIVGLIALITGKFVLNKGITLTGTPARIAGGIFMLPIPLALGAGVILGLLMSSDATGIAAVVEIVIVLACLGGGYLYANANKPAPTLPPLQPPQEPPAVPPVQ